MHEIAITTHALDRYRERIDWRATDAEIYAILKRSAAAIEAAAAFGCEVVRLGTGAKLVLSGRTMVTVLSRHQIAAGSRFVAAHGGRAG